MSRRTLDVLRLLAATRSLLSAIYEHPYNRQHPIFAFFRLIRWQTEKRLYRSARIYAFWGSRRILCYPDSLESMWLVYNYYMDWAEFAFIRRYVRPSDTLFDVGTNIGIYMLWMSQFIERGGELFGFEPDPKNHARCRENLTLNALGRPILERLALSDRDGEMRFSAGKDMENHLVHDEGFAGDTITVQTTTLDKYVEQHGIERIHFMKIDVEGAEFMVLQGAAKALASGRFGAIQLEITDALQKYGLRQSDLFKLLAEHDYAIYRYDMSANELIPVTPQTPLPQNVYAIRDIEAVRARLLSPQLARSPHSQTPFI